MRNLNASTSANYPSHFTVLMNNYNFIANASGTTTNITKYNKHTTKQNMIAHV